MTHPDGKTLLDDLVAFSRLQLESQDVDPLYPILAHLQKGMDGDLAITHTLRYVAYYNVASSERAGLALGQARHDYRLARPDLGDPWIETLKYPTGVERRGLRTREKMERHLVSLDAHAAAYGGWWSWLTSRFVGNPLADWTELRDTLMTAWGNGRWASYKTAEILMKVNGFPVTAKDMGHDSSSGPRQGLEMFYAGLPKGNTEAALVTLDRCSRNLHARVGELGLSLGIEQLETMLCDFHAMADGRYYNGNDIDANLWQIVQIGEPPLPLGQQSLAARTPLQYRLLEARAAAIPVDWRGENHIPGWDGVRSDLKSIYKEKGIVVSGAAGSWVL